MDLPQLPTDNLYKFVAIAGLVLFVVSVVFPMREAWEVERRLARLDARVDATLLAQSLVAPGINRFRVLRNRMAQAGDTVSDSTLSEWEHVTDSIRDTWSHILGEGDEETVRLLTEEVSNQSADFAELNALTQQIEQLHQLAWWGGGLGAVLTALGFGFWLFRVQLHQDAALRRRAEADTEQSTPQKPG